MDAACPGCVLGADWARGHWPGCAVGEALARGRLYVSSVRVDHEVVEALPELER